MQEAMTSASNNDNCPINKDEYNEIKYETISILCENELIEKVVVHGKVVSIDNNDTDVIYNVTDPEDNIYSIVDRGGILRMVEVDDKVEFYCETYSLIEEEGVTTPQLNADWIILPDEEVVVQETAPKVEETEPVVEAPEQESPSVNVNTSDYTEYSYHDILKYCEKNKAEKVKVLGIVYSVLETPSSIIYNVSDQDGYMYSIVDNSGGALPKGAKTNMIYFYCVPNGTSSMNGTTIPKLNTDWLEISG
jgi:hypothetical protein